MENLVLCHTACNRRLADLPIVEKVQRREQRLREEWLASARSKLANLI
ncbi:hypothetical protein ACUXST_001470 [Sphingomonas sp. F9_3S_D5_B_2]